MFWNGFYKRKRQFSSNYYNPQFHHMVRPDDHLQEAGPHFLVTAKRAWEMHFWDPSHWDKMSFEYQRIKWKNGSKFSHLLKVRAEGLTNTCNSLIFGTENLKKIILYLCWCIVWTFMKSHMNHILPSIWEQDGCWY